MPGKKFDPKKLHRLNDPRRLLDIPPAFVCARLSGQRPDVLLEIGAGTGFFSVAFHRQCNAATTYACDLSPDMIKWMEENVSPQHPYIIPVKNQESAIPLAGGIADLVFMINLHHELEDQLLMLREAYRLLKTNGEIFIIDWKKRDMPQGPPVAIRWTPEAVAKQLRTAGFRNLRSCAELSKHFLVVGKKS